MPRQRCRTRRWDRRGGRGGSPGRSCGVGSDRMPDWLLASRSGSSYRPTRPTPR